jgi:hypothetical protein
MLRSPTTKGRPTVTTPTTTPRTLPAGTRIRIEITRYESYTGTVLEATNHGGTSWEPKDNWHVIFSHDRAQPGHLGPGSWKQAIDGGKLVIL